MSRVCILTDSTVQFTRLDFPGRERVFIAPFNLKPAAPQGAASLPGQPPAGRLDPPTSQGFRRLYQELSREYDSILVLTLSSLLGPVSSHAASAAAQFVNHASVDVLDTRTTSTGLGWLVEGAAAAAAAGEAAGKIIDQVRATIPHIYLLFFIPELGALTQAGHLDPAQALVARMLGILPIFTLEDGRLAPLEKARSQRAVLEFFEEFLDEFSSPKRVALMHGTGRNVLRTGSLRQHIREVHPGAHFSEGAFPQPVEMMLGEQSIGMAVMQKG
jgi:DegV family protein with EDD domain